MKIEKGVCCILNFAPHYRQEIYTLLEKDLGCTFFFGSDTFAKNLKKMDYASFVKRPIELRFIKLWGNFNWINGSIQQVFKKEFSKFVIIGEPFCISSWFLMTFCRLLNKPCYVWTHGWYGRETKSKRLIKKLYFKLPKGIFLYGDYAKNLMIKEGFDATKLFVVYNSLAYSKQIEQRKKLIFSEINDADFFHKRPVIIFIGRITIQKKISLLIDALSILLGMGKKGFNILIIGDGQQLLTLKSYASEKKVDDYIIFLGACYDESELSQRIFNADICVSPGELGLTGMHALGYGTPVITHDNFCEQMPEFEAVQHGINGMFFKENSAESLALTINDWLEKHPLKSSDLVKTCMRIIDEKYNPYFQLKVISKVLIDSKSVA